VRDVAELLAPLAAPAVQAILTPKVGHSWFLGAPQLGDGVAWPEKDGRRLDFLACVDLAEVAAVERVPWLPTSGSLSFFYDREQQPWGFDPADLGSWAVVYQADSPKPQTGHEGRHMMFRAIRSIPGSGRSEVMHLHLSEPEDDQVYELRESSFGGEAAHQVGGYPEPMQDDDMEFQSQLVSNGIYLGDAKGYHTPLAKSLEPGAASWRLLFQIGSDDKLDFMWGDAGMLYFWIREEDARATRFDRTWLILQAT
jgi:uncharacterized protein YwqG